MLCIRAVSVIVTTFEKADPEEVSEDKAAAVTVRKQISQCLFRFPFGRYATICLICHAHVRESLQFANNKFKQHLFLKPLDLNKRTANR